MVNLVEVFRMVEGPQEVELTLDELQLILDAAYYTMFDADGAPVGADERGGPEAAEFRNDPHLADFLDELHKIWTHFDWPGPPGQGSREVAVPFDLPQASRTRLLGALSEFDTGQTSWKRNLDNLSRKLHLGSPSRTATDVAGDPKAHPSARVAADRMLGGK